MRIPGRRLRSCLTAPRRAERAFRRVASSALIRLGRAIAPSTSDHPHSAQPHTPNPPPPQTLPEAEAEVSDTPPAQPTQGPAPGIQNLPPSVHDIVYPQHAQALQPSSSSGLHTRTPADDDELHPEHHEPPGATYSPPAQAVPIATSLQTDTPPMPLSPALSALQPDSSSGLHTRTDDEELHPGQHELPGATYSSPARAAPVATLQTDTPRMPPSTVSAADDSPPPSPPPYQAEPPASHFPPAASYDMTPQGAFAPLAGPSGHHHEGALPQARPFQPPASIDMTPQQHAHALAAFLPSPTTVQGRLRPATPPTISPRVMLGDMGMTRFIQQNEETAPSGPSESPRYSWRGSPYRGESPPRVRTNRALSLSNEMHADGNALASGSGLPAISTSEIENPGMVVDAVASSALNTSRVLRGELLDSPGLPEHESFESQRSARRSDTPPAAFTSNLSPPQAAGHAEVEEMEIDEPIVEHGGEVVGVGSVDVEDRENAEDAENREDDHEVGEEQRDPPAEHIQDGHAGAHRDVVMLGAEESIDAENMPTSANTANIISRHSPGQAAESAEAGVQNDDGSASSSRPALQEVQAFEHDERDASPPATEDLRTILSLLCTLAAIAEVSLPANITAERIILLVGGALRRLQSQQAEEAEQRDRVRRQLEEQMNTEMVQSLPAMRLFLGGILNEFKDPAAPASQDVEPANSFVAQI